MNQQEQFFTGRGHHGRHHGHGFGRGRGPFGYGGDGGWGWGGWDGGWGWGWNDWAWPWSEEPWSWRSVMRYPEVWGSGPWNYGSSFDPNYGYLPFVPGAGWYW